MDKGRVKEIVASPVMVNVTYNGSRIYIEDVNENKNTASVHYIDHPDNKFEVSLNNLVEQ